MGGDARSHLALLGFATASLGRRPGRALAVAGGLVAAVSLIAAVLFVTDALRGEASRAREASPDLVVQRLVGGRPALVDSSFAATLARTPGVREATARVWGYVFFPSVQGNVTVIGTGAGAAAGTISEGRGLLPGERGACVLGRELARTLGLRAGDRLHFPSPDDRGPALVVVGLFSSPVSLYTSDVAMLSEPDARSVLALPENQAVDIAIQLTNPDESRIVALSAEHLFPGARVLEKRLFERVHALAYGRRSGFVLGATLPALLALLVLAQDRASGLGPSERREIAILKACGWSTSDVLFSKMYEAALVGIGSSAIGVVLAYMWAFLLGAPGLREVLSGWSVLYPGAHLTPLVTLEQMLGVVALVAAPYVALAIGPAWRASTLDPMEALREG